MKIASYFHAGRSSYGIVTGENWLIDVGRLADTPPTLREVLAHGYGLADHADDEPTIHFAEVDWLPPIWGSDRTLCVGLNYRSHLAELDIPAPEYPMLFTRWADSVVGHECLLSPPADSRQFDFEGELAIVIGREGRHVAAADALAYVAGYTCFNDGSVRDYQRHTSQFYPGKNFWRSGSCGPWIATEDEFTDGISGASVSTRLNGELMQEAKFDDLLFDVPTLVSYVSRISMLRPGDVICTGTPGGVGAGRTPQVWMQPNDHVEVAIDGVGTLSNWIADEVDTA